jgi:GTPase SAR1 family protein
MLVQRHVSMRYGRALHLKALRVGQIYQHDSRCIAANKSDLADRRVVTQDEGRQAAEEHGAAHYFETSAKTNEGIDGAFPIN